MAEFLEIGMLIMFGFSWPMNVIKSYKSLTAKGKSLGFLLCIITGYIFGILSKIFSDGYAWYVMFFYVLNLSMVTADLILYFRNCKIDRRNSNG